MGGVGSSPQYSKPKVGASGQCYATTAKTESGKIPGNHQPEEG